MFVTKNFPLMARCVSLRVLLTLMTSSARPCTLLSGIKSVPEHKEENIEDKKTMEESHE